MKREVKSIGYSSEIDNDKGRDPKGVMKRMREGEEEEEKKN